MAAEGSGTAFLIVARRGVVLAYHRIDETLLVGSSYRCAVPLPGRDVPRHQCAIQPKDGRFFLQDRSGKGTRVSGREVAEAWLSFDDRIEVGAFRLFLSEMGISGHGDAEAAQRTLPDAFRRRGEMPEELWLNARLSTGGPLVQIPFDGEA